MESAFITCNDAVKRAYGSINYKETFFLVSGSQSESEEPSAHKLSGIPSFPLSPGHHIALLQSLLPLPGHAPVLSDKLIDLSLVYGGRGFSRADRRRLCFRL